MGEMDFQDSDWVGNDDAPVAETSVKELEKLSADIKAARDKYDAINAQLKEADRACAALEMTMLEKLEQLGKTKYVSEVGTIGITHRSTIRVPKGEDWLKFRSYLEQTGEAEALLSVNSQTLNGWYKNKFEEAKERGEGASFAVPGLAEPSIQKIISFRKQK